MKRTIARILVPLLSLLSPPLRASDHIDGSATSKHRVVDLSDLYAFPTPQKSGFLTIILDMYPLVSPRGTSATK
jgi:hypothetical protein